MKMVNGIPKWKHGKFHKVLIKNHGNANRCENKDCQFVNPKRFEWALRIGHQYSSDPKDYIQLCTSCHRKYDFNEEIRAKLKAKKYGDKHNAAKLTNDQVLTIKLMLSQGVQNKVIASQFNIHPTTVCDIKRGKRWGYLN